MSNQRKFILLLCCFFCSTQTWNMEGENKNVSEELVLFIVNKRKDASDNVNRAGLSRFAWLAGYGDVQKEDLELLIDFLPEKNEEIKALISEWKSNDSLSQERKNAWKGKSYPEVVAYLKECKVRRLQELTQKTVQKEEIYSTLRSEELSKEKAQEIILQDLADLYMYEQELQPPSLVRSISTLWSKK